MKDFNKKSMDELGHGVYTPMDIGLLPPLYLIYAENPSDSGKVSVTRQNFLYIFFFHRVLRESFYLHILDLFIHKLHWCQVHSTVRQRWLDGDEFIKVSMEEVANLALEGQTALNQKDHNKLTSLMNRNFDLRR